MQRGFHEAAIYFGKVKCASRGGCCGSTELGISLLDNPDAKFFCENGGHAAQKEKTDK